MKAEHLSRLACPRCGSPFRFDPGTGDGGAAGRLVCTRTSHAFGVTRSIPRFVPEDNYAGSFGFQWTAFSRVQLDSYNGTEFSEERFRTITGWTPEDLAGKRVLDAGCGAGRFAEIALKYRADLVAFDLSSAADVCRLNVAPADPLVCQASIYELPFPPGQFDLVYCIGVIQHTPDPEASIRALCRMVRPGGRIALWIYERDWKSRLGTLGFKYLLRPLFRRLSRRLQYSVCKALVAVFYPLAWLCQPLGLPGKVVLRLLPIAAASLQDVPLRTEDFKAWILLDTFDMYSPAYDLPQTYGRVAAILTEESFERIERHSHGGISITGARRLEGSSR